MGSAAADDNYGSEYYAESCGGIPYSWDEPHWQAFFRNMAARIVEAFAPSTALDAGCAKGFLVATLRENGVEAEGFDISDYAVQAAPVAARGHVRVGSLLEPLTKRYDLITCIEVLEHIPAQEVQQAIDTLCSATDLVILSSTSEDFREATHINVRRPEEWAADFARRGFFRRVSADVSFISPWAVVFERRAGMTAADVAFAYESVLAPRLNELAVKRDELQSVQALLNAERSASSSGEVLADSVAKGRDWLAVMDQLIGLRAENDELRFRMAESLGPDGSGNEDLRATTTWRIGTAALAPVRALRRRRGFAHRARLSLRRRALEWRRRRAL
jgi:SAM-dependent methyltransferase